MQHWQLGRRFPPEYEEGMNKSERMEAFVATLGATDAVIFDPCYLGYFECFNTHRYYEAHDVLEHLWVKEGRSATDYAFYKGLIQLAGAFVHLKLQYTHPRHPKHGKRLAPARRLFLCAGENLMPFSPFHRGLDLEIPISLARRYAERLTTESDINPWSPGAAPFIPAPEEIL